MEDLLSLKSKFNEELNNCSDLKSIEDLRIKYLGKKGLVTLSMSSLKDMNVEQKKAFGSSINELKDYITSKLNEMKSIFEAKELNEKLLNEQIDITLKPRSRALGKLHPISRAIQDIKDIFSSMGFDCVSGPEIDTEWYNFDALNIGQNHPSRQMHDTFYLNNEKLLRTHTSTVQIRHMSNNQPPFKVISIGRVYRSDSDATHTPMFHQIEGLCVDEKITMSDLKGVLEDFLKYFFETKEVPIRLRPSFFPFTEPSAEVDMQCDRSDRSQIKIGTGSDWLEILGCGMVHPFVLKNVGVDTDIYSGYAFGIGIERLAMLKYNIPDLRDMYASDMRWLSHYNL